MVNCLIWIPTRQDSIRSCLPTLSLDPRRPSDIPKDHVLLDNMMFRVRICHFAEITDVNQYALESDENCYESMITVLDPIMAWA